MAASSLHEDSHAGTRHAFARFPESNRELALLARTAGVIIVGETAQKIARINPATLIGKGKLQEIVAQRGELLFDTVIFDEELHPNQQRDIEEAFGGSDIKILDRTALILDIFAQHARSREGALQVELAQYEYRLPRLTRMWTHLARQAGCAAGRGGTGGVGLRGPGEFALQEGQTQPRERITPPASWSGQRPGKSRPARPESARATA